MQYGCVGIRATKVSTSTKAPVGTLLHGLTCPALSEREKLRYLIFSLTSMPDTRPTFFLSFLFLKYSSRV